MASQTLKRTIKPPVTSTGFSTLPQDSKELLEMLENAVSSHARAEVTLSVQGTLFKTKLPGQPRVLAGNSECLEFPMPIHFKTMPSEAFVVLFLQKSNLLCLQSSKIELAGDRLAVHTPWRAFRLQRRGNLRVEIGGAYEHLAELFVGLGSPMSARIMDLSIEGMSILVSNDQAQRLTKGTKINSVIFRIDGNPINLDAVVTYQAVHSSRGIRVGLKFSRILNADAELISVFMARHLVQSFG